jgi:hypothetical protein
MEDTDVEEPLLRAARAIGDAVEFHARACLGDPSDVVGIVQAGETLVAAVLEYEKRLSVDTGWSNPVRHLGRLPQYDASAGADPTDASLGPQARITAKYLVEIDDEGMLGNLAEGRGGDRQPGVEGALRFLAESDGWDVSQYPPGAMRLIAAGVDVSAHPDQAGSGSG